MIDNAFGHWLAGFSDGEGSFTIGRNGDKGLTKAWGTRFSIGLRADDRPILDEICGRTGLGRIYGQRKRPPSRPGAVWTVVSRSDCRSLVDIFDAYPLRAKKAKDYEIWREAVLYCSGLRISSLGYGKGTAEMDWAPVERLAYALREGRAYDAPEPDTPIPPVSTLSPLVLFGDT